MVRLLQIKSEIMEIIVRSPNIGLVFRIFCNSGSVYHMLPMLKIMNKILKNAEIQLLELTKNCHLNQWILHVACMLEKVEQLLLMWPVPSLVRSQGNVISHFSLQATCRIYWCKWHFFNSSSWLLNWYLISMKSKREIQRFIIHNQEFLISCP